MSGIDNKKGYVLRGTLTLALICIACFYALPSWLAFTNHVVTPISFCTNCLYAAIIVGLIAMLILYKKELQLTPVWFKQYSKLLSVTTLIVFLSQFLTVFLSLLKAHSRIATFAVILKNELYTLSPILGIIGTSTIARAVFKRQTFQAKADVTETSGQFGTASWAKKEDLIKLNAYDAKNGLLIGKDFYNYPLYFSLVNKLTIAPPGGGKTICSTMIALLSYFGPIFAFDVKGELWATTARYRSEVLKRNVIALDPYGVTKSADFRHGKPEHLCIRQRLNPFDFIPENEALRDRMINAFASSFIIHDKSGHAQHFDENARILIRGYIDYMMKKFPKEKRTLANLYNLMSEDIKDANQTFDHMSGIGGRAAAAANQIKRVGKDERGSILSSSYRQIDWMSDSNIQDTFSHSTFDLRDFLKGNMDIYIILPEEQIHEQSRLVRMLLALLKALIVQANPSELPQQKMLFLLDELAQLGYCPDVEQFIEVLRGRGVVVWATFQALSQIKLYQKPDLFTGMPLKQIFTLDDKETLQWIQTLCSKRTIVTKSLSNSNNDSTPKQQPFGGSLSKGEGESVRETGVDLIQLNEIREMPNDQQLVFLHGTKPIKCKKVRYFEHDEFRGRYDENPIEKS